MSDQPTPTTGEAQPLMAVPPTELLACAAKFHEERAKDIGDSMRNVTTKDFEVLMRMVHSAQMHRVAAWSLRQHANRKLGDGR